MSVIHGFVTHRMACYCDERAPHGRCNRNHVVYDAVIFGVSNIRDVEDVAYRVRQALQTAAGLLGFGHQ